MNYPYIPHTDEERQAMLKAVGVETMEDLFDDVDPDIMLSDSVPLAAGKSEEEVVRMIRKLAQRNVKGIPFLGCGSYDHIVPSCVTYLSSLPSFVTAYTPYQAEMSQGVLEAIFEFQSYVATLTGMDVVNASLYDGSTAACDAASVMLQSKKKSKKVLVSPTIHPFTVQVMKTWAMGTDVELEFLDEREGVCDFTNIIDRITDDCAGLIVQSPNRYGYLEDYTGLADVLHSRGSYLAMSADLLTTAKLKNAAEWGADIAFGDTQSLGLQMGFGGPNCGYMGVRQEFMRKIPGRIVGQTVDVSGNVGYVLTLQAREQHIKRERASSNICSNQSLCALMTAIHISMLGEEGMKEAFEQSYAKAHFLAQKLEELPYIQVKNKRPFFCEFPIVFKDAKHLRKFIQELRNEGIFAGVRLSDITFRKEDELTLIVAVTEKRTREEMEMYLSAAWRVTK